MPQMAPMWWTTIMTMTFMLMFMMTIMMYFLYYKLMTKNIKIKNDSMNWTW